MLYWFNRAPGPVLALLHGFTGDVHAWDEVVEHLPRELAVVGLSLPGHHRDSPAQSSFEATCDALAETLAELGAAFLHLAGYSLGARLALGIALRHAALVQRVTLVGAHVGLEVAEERQMRAAADARWVQLLETEGIAAFATAWAHQPIFASQQALSGAQRAQQQQRRLGHSAAGLAQSLRSCGLAQMPNYWPELTRNTVELQFVAGRVDQKFSAIAKRAGSLAPNAGMQLIEGCGHNPLIEAPAALAALLAKR